MSRFAAIWLATVSLRLVSISVWLTTISARLANTILGIAFKGSVFQVQLNVGIALVTLRCQLHRSSRSTELLHLTIIVSVDRIIIHCLHHLDGPISE